MPITLKNEESGGRLIVEVPNPNEAPIQLHFEEPQKFIAELEQLGKSLRKFAKNISDPSDPNALSNQQVIKTLSTTQLEKHHSVIDIDDELYLHAFNVCWEDATHNAKKDHTKKLKADINRKQRHDINLARQFLNAQLNYDADTFALENIADEEERKIAAKVLEETEAAITNYETRTQTALRYIGYFLGGIFALAQGGNNGKSMGASIIAIAALIGITGLSLSMPYIAIPALAIGVSSFVINALIAIRASGNTFKGLFGRDNVLEPLYNYRDENGVRTKFTNKQIAGFIFGGLIPTLFSAISLAGLGGYVLMLTISAASATLAPFALPIAVAITLSCATALFFVYLQDSASLFYFDSNVKGWDAVKEFASKLLFPTKVIDARVNAKGKSLEKLLNEHGPDDLKAEDRNQIINDYKARITSMSKVLSGIFIPLALAGIGLTLFGAAIAVPGLLPFISFGAACVMAVLAMPGQMPFYNAAAVGLATKVAMFFTPKPQAIKDAERNAFVAKQQAAIKADSEELEPLVAPVATNREAAEKANLQEKYEAMGSIERLTYNTKQILTRAIEGITALSKAGNPLGNGAIGMVAFIGVSWITGTFSAILLPVSFLLGSFASAAVGYSRDTVEPDLQPAENRFQALFADGKQPAVQTVTVTEELSEAASKQKQKDTVSVASLTGSKLGALGNGEPYEPTSVENDDNRLLQAATVQ